MKTKTVVKIISLLSAALAVCAVFAVKEKVKSKKYLLMIENQYTSSLEQLNSSLNNIALSLEKTAYVSSAKKLSSIASEIFSEAELAKNALADLPSGEGELSTIYKFLSQAGNYALAVSKNITAENSVSEKQRSELKILSETANKISEVIGGSNIEFNNSDAWAKSVENQLSGTVNQESLAQSLTELEENLSDYPTLIYDGPYSDHILNKQPLMTATAIEYSEAEALEAAKNITDGNIDLTFDGMQSGKIECYRFTGVDTTVSVSKAGGYVVYMRKNRIVGDTLLSYEQALTKAKKFLEKSGISSLTDTYYYTDGGVCVINFAYLDGQTICYTDLIKVGVAMDTGEIMLLETSGYLTNHTERAFQIPDYTADEAATKISTDLEISQSAITLIPTDGGGEVRCYEFLCLGENDREILVYINVNTLEEEQIYILLKTDGGTLVR